MSEITAVNKADTLMKLTLRIKTKKLLDIPKIVTLDQVVTNASLVR